MHGVISDADRLTAAIVGLGVDPSRDSLRRANDVVAGRFEFLNRSESLPIVDWTKPYVNRLWTYNLHYFDYAIDLAWAFRLTGDKEYVRTFETLVTTWINATQDGRGAGWDPYPISARTVNWVYAVLLFQNGLTPEFRARIIASAFRQLCFLEGRVEWHLLGNHVFKNLKALAVGGLFFDGPEAERWAVRAVRQLWDQTKEQVGEDGAHFERSPMYHAIVLSDLLEVIHLLRSRGQAAPPEIEERARRMARALTLLTRQAISLRLLNDSARGIAPSSQHLTRVAERVVGLPTGVLSSAWSLQDTGYFGYRDSTGQSELIISCREPSPPYQPGHAHCDILSFEWETAGQPVIVDSGLHGYDGDPYREYVRSTRAHNTVVIDGKDQSEAWATFRFARRATEVHGTSSLRDGGYAFHGTYRPYHDARARHQRTIVLKQNEMLVTDVVEEQKTTPLESFLHFHPDFRISVIDGRVSAESGSLRLKVEPFGVDTMTVMRGQLEPTQGWFCEEFGKAVPQDVLVMRIEKNRGAEFGYRITRESENREK